ncbi:MAG: transposase [Thiohalocapsa sp.]|jgi:putative transposase
MARRPRINAAGYPAHVVLRGIDRRAIFFGDDDYRYFLDKLAVLSAEESVAVSAYVLMTNHVHLLLTPETDTGVTHVMKRLGQRYVQYVNRLYARSGTLFEGRFRSSLIEADAYLLACQRYIELNPVRAGLVHAPGEYQWSSYRANALGAHDPVVTMHPLLAALGASGPQRQAAYRALFAEKLDQELLERIRGAVNSGFVLGNERFEQQIAEMLGRRTWRGAPGRPRKKPSGEKPDRLSGSGYRGLTPFFEEGRGE